MLRALPVRSYASRNVMEPRVKNVACRNELVSMRWEDALHRTDLFGPFDWTESSSGLPYSLKPDTVTHQSSAPMRDHHDHHGNTCRRLSSQAVIRSASSGTSNSLNSSSVLVHTSAATIPPALVPVTTFGKRSASRNALTTPKW
jgi:hypothetical protein